MRDSSSILHSSLVVARAALLLLTEPLLDASHDPGGTDLGLSGLLVLVGQTLMEALDAKG